MAAQTVRGAKSLPERPVTPPSAILVDGAPPTPPPTQPRQARGPRSTTPQSPCPPSRDHSKAPALAEVEEEWEEIEEYHLPQLVYDAELPTEKYFSPMLEYINWPSSPEPMEVIAPSSGSTSSTSVEPAAEAMDVDPHAEVDRHEPETSVYLRLLASLLDGSYQIPTSSDSVVDQPNQPHVLLKKVWWIKRSSKKTNARPPLPLAKTATNGRQAPQPTLYDGQPVVEEAWEEGESEIDDEPMEIVGTALVPSKAPEASKSRVVVASSRKRPASVIDDESEDEIEYMGRSTVQRIHPGQNAVKRGEQEDTPLREHDDGQCRRCCENCGVQCGSVGSSTKRSNSLLSLEVQANILERLLGPESLREKLRGHHGIHHWTDVAASVGARPEDHDRVRAYAKRMQKIIPEMKHRGQF